jgi:hypothetical protein
MFTRATRRFGAALLAFSLLCGLTAVESTQAQEELPADLVGCGVGDGTHTVNFLRQTGGFWFQNGIYNLSPDSTTNGGPRLDQLTTSMGGTLAPGVYQVFGISFDDHLQNPLDTNDTAPFEQFAVALGYGTADEVVSEVMPDLPDDAQWQSNGTFADDIQGELIPGPGSPFPPRDPVTPDAVAASRPGAPLGQIVVTAAATEVTAVHATVLDPGLVPEARAFGNSIVPWEAAFVCAGDVAVTKAVGAESAAAGTPFTWTVTVAADEAAPASGLILEDPLPAGLTVVGDPTADTGSVEIVDGTLHWTGDLDPGAVATITVTTSFADAAAFNLCSGGDDTVCTNTATLVDHADTNPDNDAASASIGFSDVLTVTTLPPVTTTAPPAQVQAKQQQPAPPAVAQTVQPSFNG